MTARGGELRERNGVRLGQRVRDLDGKALGRVTRLHDWGFTVQRGALLFRRDFVVRYEEVRDLRDGVLVVARSGEDLFALARGGIPPSWRVPAGDGLPPVATPPEARFLPGGPERDGRLPPERDPPRYPHVPAHGEA